MLIKKLFTWSGLVAVKEDEMHDDGPTRLIGRWGDSGRGRLWLALVLGVVVAAGASVFAWASLTSAHTSLPEHGIGLSKGCESPTQVGSSYTCEFTISNTLSTDNGGDTLTITALVDTVHATGGNVVSGNLLPTATLTLSGGATCNPGQTLCTLPTGASIATEPIALYTVKANDPNPLTDDVVLTWQDLCTSGAKNCPTGNQHATTASQSAVQTATFTPTNTPPSTNTATATPTNTPTSTPTTPLASGCTPGFWKNHTDAWGPTGFSPSQTVGSVFVSAPSAFAGITLLDALRLKGGPGVSGADQILLRAAVAALLNASDPSLSYALTPQMVILRVNAALASNDRATILALATTLDGYNNAGCPLS